LRGTTSRRRQHGHDVSAARCKRDEFLTKFEDAASLKIEGEIGAYLDRLCALADSPELAPHFEKNEQLRELTESVKFGGLILSPDQLTWAEKKVKDALSAAFPIDGREAG
jgi:hypothetical protein